MDITQLKVRCVVKPKYRDLVTALREGGWDLVVLKNRNLPWVQAWVGTHRYWEIPGACPDNNGGWYPETGVWVFGAEVKSLCFPEPNPTIAKFLELVLPELGWHVEEVWTLCEHDDVRTYHEIEVKP